MPKILADDPMLTLEERAAINRGPWFASLSPSLRHDILRRAFARRFRHGDVICERGSPADDWSGVARGAVRVCNTSGAGRESTLTYVQPGAWIGDVAIFSDGRRTHDGFAHGRTTLLTLTRADLREILVMHVELYEALLRLNASRLTQLFKHVEDLSTLSLRARLAKQIKTLVRNYGIPSAGGEVQIGLPLAQEELAKLLGASRQRVNVELKTLERDEVIRIHSCALVVRNHAALERLAEAA